MTTKDYQTPELLILLFYDKDVLRTSNWTDGNNENLSFDKGVEDFFGQ